VTEDERNAMLERVGRAAVELFQLATEEPESFADAVTERNRLLDEGAPVRPVAFAYWQRRLETLNAYLLEWQTGARR
jgi:hypothetical protein